MILKFQKNKNFNIHLLYWVVFVLFFTLVWGTYDSDYFRNFMIQLWSLPSRVVLVYVTLQYLIPKFLLQEKYFKFVSFFIILLLFTSLFIQRFVMFYIVQKSYLPYKSEQYFAITELMNTILDVNLAVIIPFIYSFYKIWRKSKQELAIIAEKNKELSKNKDDKHIYLKEGKSIQKVFLKDIIFIESLKNYVRVKTTEKEIISYNGITSMEKMLPKEIFLRVHRSYIISTDYINSFSPSQIDLQGIIIPIGRKYKEIIKEKLGYY